MDFALKTKGNVSQSKDRKVLKIVDIFPLGNFGIYQFTNFIIFFFYQNGKKKFIKFVCSFITHAKSKSSKFFLEIPVLLTFLPSMERIKQALKLS